MASIYQCSHLQLAASSASDCTKGLFMDPQTSARDSLSMLETRPNQKIVVGRGTVTAQQPNLVQADSPMTIYASLHATIALKIDLDSQPLNQRGWVLQETLLSRRTVHFIDNQLVWECRDLFESNDRAVGEFPGITPLHKGPNISDWDDIAKTFSGLAFSIPVDQPAAIAGLIEWTNFSEHDEPMLGLWKRSIEFDLSWKPIPLLSSNLEGEQQLKADRWVVRIPGLSTYPTWS